MADYLQFIKNYKENDQYRESFFELANSVFGLNFASWYENGFWGDRYVPFSYADGKKIVANVSVNILDMIIDGKQHHALQIGTVMTHPDYRDQGLSKRLMNKVLEDYKDSNDFMYLFANDSVLDFYPKFGFEKVPEYQYWTTFLSSERPIEVLRKLDVSNRDDLLFIYSFALDRIPVSNHFATSNSQGILMYHCLNVFPNEVYYHNSENAIVIFNKSGNEIEIFDIISKAPVNIQNIFVDLAGEGRSKVIFHYTPDYEGLVYERNRIQGGGTLFVKTNGDYCYPEGLKHPVTSEA
ncbi:GNAT family N-acetyltransferase [Neobacillus kokaensis]|uniref:GNAT family acetyltransferase n=1 Tax=Neobacillus kokaensis TaxID=2759023 RepID=A0ABQ3NAG7_9BACI|nr:GNAT family N-acetyltransferase [Neobacillus kokaensis]GHH99311.1 GNAT family acetyltransferase [Neobacillus kokaensis]